MLRREDEYPENVAAAAAERGARLIAVVAEAQAREAGSTGAVNVFLLGVASYALPFTEDAWRRGLAAAVPAKILGVNEWAFALGRDAVTNEEVGQ